MALDGLGLGVYEETEVDGEYADVGLDASLMTTGTPGVVVEENDPSTGVKTEGIQQQQPEAGWPSTFGSPGQYEAAGFGAPPQATQDGSLGSPVDVISPAAGSPDGTVAAGSGGTGGVLTGNDMTENAGKLFLGGISWQTDENQLHSYFGAYGNVIDVAVMRNKQTGVSRGFAFVTFANAASVDAVLTVEHQLDGRRIDIKRAVPRDRAPPPAGRQAQHRGGNFGLPPHHTAHHQVSTNQGGYSGYGGGQYFQQDTDQRGTLFHQRTPGAFNGGPSTTLARPITNGPPPQRKLFVGGLAPTVTEAQFREYFSSFGNVVDAVVMFDRATQRSRGFGFVTFSDDASIRAVLSATHELQGKYVEVKSAEPRWGQTNNNNSNLLQQHHQQQANLHYSGQPYNNQSATYGYQQYSTYPSADQTGYSVQAYGTGYQEQDPYSDQRNATNFSNRYDPYITYQQYTQQHRESQPPATSGNEPSSVDPANFMYDRGDQQLASGTDPYNYNQQPPQRVSNTAQQQYPYAAPDPFYRGTTNSGTRTARPTNRPGVGNAGAYRGY
uniref:RRM domain-containing protein n=1 Tax=Aureoumbra lagunensis TaxID=44058 RepID=A0A7S3NJV6_9STRA|mmetsp:Transcript_17126/g.22226  ORF Transcript_17126/g.22226 Transcript_17126/m.22226 type:complete len:553 (+) Transcript_17126:229-1887(+)|eukprot:CAMPEP_0197289996 /NCGR_PEP_ID=MMETSP0890-20130614/7247_1 /TAXON_ID=44058 ORGANISM="Aureoumbra lagunensis, Strain CCMP1510" /NCGR_SAMPLE_ID=MMETSP0890 /ASSEMBLY_ACC=CAM_ASM_000533 /LENGTH=552 /DNA_ID=CAMNT_0042761745 /DNA_START=226 /DNA_END=1884 /DNA_ORIENTATION=-